MSKLTTTTRVIFTEVDGLKPPEPPKLPDLVRDHVKIMSHEKKSDEVVLDFSFMTCTVKADHLMRAITNATNQPK